MIINGIIYKNGTIELGKWYKVEEGQDDLNEIMPGDYMIQMLDQDKNVLQEIRFNMDFFVSEGENGLVETDFAPFSFAVPYSQNTSFVKIYRANAILTEIDLGTKLLSDALNTLPSDYDMLIESVEETNIQGSIKNSLTSKLNNAKRKAEEGIVYINEGYDKLGKNMLNSASNIVNAFINEVNAQKGKKISEENANEFIEWAEKMILTLQIQIISTL